MGYITYKQADSRWGNKNYNGSSTMAAAGCGPTSCAMLAYAVDGKTTPLQTMKFMQTHGYAIRNNGTAWNGIPACLTYFGLKDAHAINVSSSMAEVWKYMSKGYCAVFLFSAGSRGGIRWTSGGHYVAVTDYKLQNGKHYLYTRDSGGRNHTGWYCYETQMKGLIPKVWVALVPGGVTPPAPQPTPTRKYNGAIPQPTIRKNSSKTKVKQLQLFLNWYGNYNLVVDGIFGNKTKSALVDFQGKEGLVADGIYGNKSYNKALLFK